MPAPTQGQTRAREVRTGAPKSFQVGSLEEAQKHLKDFDNEALKAALTKAMKGSTRGITVNRPQVVIFTHSGKEYLGVRESAESFWVKEVTNNTASALAVFFRRELASKSTATARDDFNPILDEPVVPVLKFIAREVPDSTPGSTPGLFSFTRQLSALDCLRMKIARVGKPKLREALEGTMREALEETMRGALNEYHTVILRHEGKQYLGIFDSQTGKVLVREVLNPHDLGEVATQYASFVARLHTAAQQSTIIR